MTVEFTEVGRNKKTWRCEVGRVTDVALKRQIRLQQALMSNDIDFDYETGAIYAGLRRVGTFRVCMPF